LRPGIAAICPGPAGLPPWAIIVPWGDVAVEIDPGIIAGGVMPGGIMIGGVPAIANNRGG
jgi:hypothetical protein